MNDKHQSVWEWLLQCPAIQDLCFNFSTDDNGTTVLMPDAAFEDEWEDGMPFIDGSGEKIYTFSIAQFRELTTESNVSKNIDVLADVNAIAEWIEEQEELKNYPVFPKNCIINEVKAVPSDSDVSVETDNKARYMFSVQIKYLFKRG